MHVNELYLTEPLSDFLSYQTSAAHVSTLSGNMVIKAGMGSFGGVGMCQVQVEH